MVVPTSEQFNEQWLNGLMPGFRRMGFAQKLNGVIDDASAIATALNAMQGDRQAMSRYPYTGQPTAGDTITIGAEGDVYEFVADEGDVAADTNIGVVIGANARASYANLVLAVNATYEDNEHPSLFQTDSETPALANGTKDVYLLHVHGGDVDTGALYLFPAVEPGGEIVDGAPPDLALTDDADNGGPWFPLNLNLSPGAGFAAATQEYHGKYAIVAASLTASQPLLVPVPFAPQSYNVQVRSADGQLKPNAYCAVTVPTAVGGQNLLGLNVKPTAPTVLQRAVVEVPLADNDISIATWALGKSIDIRAISFSCGEDPGSTLVVDISKVTAATAGDPVALTTVEDIAGGTQAGQITALDLDEVGGDIPIDVTAAQALLFTVTAGSGTVAPRSVTFYIDYVEKVVATDVVFFDVYGA